jgi:hypothetical protein
VSAQEIDEYTGKPYDVDVGHVLTARKLWKRYSNTNGSSERAFIHVIAPVLAAQPESEALALLRELNDALLPIPDALQARLDAVLDRCEVARGAAAGLDYDSGADGLGGQLPQK